MDVLNGLADFFSDFADRGSSITDFLKNFFDFLFDPAFRGAGLGLGTFGGRFASATGFGTEDSDGGLGFSGGE